ncbi:hypothetical protein M2140_000712 [Clostridiales Family XIII bacterium PM5-7]
MIEQVKVMGGLTFKRCIMKKKTLYIVILCIVLSIMTASCGKEDREIETKTKTKTNNIQWNVPILAEDDKPSHLDIKMDDYHITSAVLLEDGIASELSKEEYLDLIDFIEVVELKKTEPNSSLRITDVKKKYDVDQLKRVTQIFFKANFIQMKSEAIIEREYNTDEAIKEIDEILREDYKVKTRGASYTSKNETEGLYPTESDTYAAILFIPKIVEFAGSYAVSENKTLPIHYCYPWTNKQDYLDGIYILVESKDVNNIPE